MKQIGMVLGFLLMTVLPLVLAWTAGAYLVARFRPFSTYTTADGSTGASRRRPYPWYVTWNATGTANNIFFDPLLQRGQKAPITDGSTDLDRSGDVGTGLERTLEEDEAEVALESEEPPEGKKATPAKAWSISDRSIS